MPNQPTTTEPKQNVICIEDGRLRFAHMRAALRQKRLEAEQPLWAKTTSVALASQRCVYCFGLGRRPGRGGATDMICRCVLRTVFRVCLNRFRSAVAREKPISRVSGNFGGGPRSNAPTSFGLRNEEYAADFVLVAFRALNEGMTRLQLQARDQAPSLAWRVFTMHYLLGADWRGVCGKLKIDRGQFFHACYRIEATVGLAFAETEPFSLFPLDEYFSDGFARSSHRLGEPKQQKTVRVTRLSDQPNCCWCDEDCGYEDFRTAGASAAA